MNYVAILLLTGILACSASIDPVNPDGVLESPDFQNSMLSGVNAIRRQGCRCGETKMPPVAPLSWNNQLEKSAGRHASDMYLNHFFSHNGSDGSSFDERIRDTGYPWMSAGENIAHGYNDVTTVIQGWIDSEAHCRQMMSPNYKEIGAARKGDYWVQDFGSRQ